MLKKKKSPNIGQHNATNIIPAIHNPLAKLLVVMKIIPKTQIIKINREHNKIAPVTKYTKHSGIDCMEPLIVLFYNLKITF